MLKLASFFLLNGIFMASFAQANLSFAFKAVSGVMEFSDAPDEQKYLETELVAIYKLSESFRFEGSIFGRFTDEKEYWGVQVTAPLTLVVPGAFLSSYIAPGYRYMNDSYSAPVIEGGLNLYFLGSFGVGYRFIFNEWIDNGGLKTESQFFVSFYF